MMEWDTCAADAILRAVGGTMTYDCGVPVEYGKPNFKHHCPLHMFYDTDSRQ
jgi:3'-phosphoadenosine 5'-phosphosulfate (PAPS) 3'-phosphatase